jgi:hypothetical protein
MSFGCSSHGNSIFISTFYCDFVDSLNNIYQVRSDEYFVRFSLEISSFSSASLFSNTNCYWTELFRGLTFQIVCVCLQFCKDTLTRFVLSSA